MHDVNEELRNLERQRESTGKIVNEIERQIGGLSSQLDRSSAELILAEDNLAERRAVLERRLVDIYKRGPLYTFQVLLAAESFGDLLSRYKYLYLTSRQDRALVTDVEKLRNRVIHQRNDLLDVRKQLDRTREEREAEFAKYSDAGAERGSAGCGPCSARPAAPSAGFRRWRRTRPGSRTCSRRWSARAETSRRAGLRGADAGPGLDHHGRPGQARLAGAGHDRLPVRPRHAAERRDHPLERHRDLGAPAGTAVKAVEAGKVRLVGQFGTYGLTVVLEHGNGYYSVYSHLQQAGVKLGASVTKGQTIGTVGGENSDYGPHLHFEIRGENQIALDPTDWLKAR